VKHVALFNTFRAIAIAGMVLATSAISSASSADFTVFNDGSVTLEHLYVSPHGRNTWDQDLLGNYVLNPGYNYKPLVNYSVPTCWQDVKAVYEDGNVVSDWDVNICAVNLHFSY
jgi:hypothetical protein